MAGQGRAALFYGPGKPFELKEYTVPEPEPGALVMKISVANVCGSDLHQWRGEFDVAKFGRPLFVPDAGRASVNTSTREETGERSLARSR